MQRRAFLIVAGSAAGVLADLVWATAGADSIAARDASPAPPGSPAPADDARSGAFEPGASLAIEPGGRIVVRVAKSEMGQGVLTALPMLVAEELDVDLAQVSVELAPGAVAFRDARGNQSTGYSSSVSSMWWPYRTLGAVARAALVEAAAERWGVAAGGLATAGGFVTERGASAAGAPRRIAYAELVDAARARALPLSASPKPPTHWRLIGRALPRVDTPSKVDGSAVFGIDVREPGMRIALIARAPALGATVESVDARRALAVKGVERVVQVSSGVAVVARDFWSARRGRDALRITWARGSRPAPDSSWIEPELRATLDGPATVARRDGDPDRWLAPIEAESAGTAAATRGAGGADAARANGARIDAEYFTPFLAHAALEPLSAAAHVQADRCDLWVATQAPSRAQDWAARVTGLPLERVFVHTRLIGGAFGRRGEWDFVVDAVEVAKAARVPVKLMWTREDDLRHDFYRPATANRLAAQLGADGLPVALAHRVAGASVARRRSPEILQRGTDFLLTQGSGDLHYAIPNVRIDYREVDQGVPVGFWRSVGHSHNGFVIESFVDEVAHAAGRDPFEYRATLLAGDARLRGVLELAAREAGWGRSLPPGRGLGIACLRSYGTCVAEVAEVEVVAGAIRVPRVVCAVDCGRVVNPRIVEQQMQGGILFGLTAALHGEVSFRDGAAQVSNYHDYPVLRIDEVPHVDVHVIASEAEPGGCGEPATPVIAPAVANAVFAATGRRLRRLPLRLDA